MSRPLNFSRTSLPFNFKSLRFNVRERICPRRSKAIKSSDKSSFQFLVFSFQFSDRRRKFLLKTEN